MSIIHIEQLLLGLAIQTLLSFVYFKAKTDIMEHDKNLNQSFI